MLRTALRRDIISWGIISRNLLPQIKQLKELRRLILFGQEIRNGAEQLRGTAHKRADQGKYGTQRAHGQLSLGQQQDSQDVRPHIGQVGHQAAGCPQQKHVPLVLLFPYDIIVRQGLPFPEKEIKQVERLDLLCGYPQQKSLIIPGFPQDFLVVPGKPEL